MNDRMSLAPTGGAMEATTGNTQVATREAAEVQAAIIAAQMCPRDIGLVMKRIEKVCAIPALAETAEYAYVKGGSTITGPSVRLVEAVAQSWGNMTVGWRVIETRPATTPAPKRATEAAVSVVEAFAWDLETNFRYPLRMEVPHWRDRQNGGGYPIHDAREIYELVANMAARRVRACMERTIPRFVIDHAKDLCRETLTEAAKPKAGEAAKANKGATTKLVRAFAPFNVTDEDLCVYAKVATLDEITPEQLVDLRAVFTAIKDGSDVGEFFPRHAKVRPVGTAADPLDAPTAREKVPSDVAGFGTLDRDAPFDEGDARDGAA